MLPPSMPVRGSKPANAARVLPAMIDDKAATLGFLCMGSTGCCTSRGLCALSLASEATRPLSHERRGRDTHGNCRYRRARRPLTGVAAALPGTGPAWSYFLAGILVSAFFAAAFLAD